MTRRLLLTVLGLLAAEEAAAQINIQYVPSSLCEPEPRTKSKELFFFSTCSSQTIRVRCDRGHMWDAKTGEYFALRLDNNPTEFCWKCLTEMLEQDLGILEREP